MMANQPRGRLGVEGTAMISGTHAIIYSRDPDADRRVFRDVLGFSSVDAGGGWLIFALPPAECAFHPAEDAGKHELYLMCDDVEAEILRLTAAGIPCGPVAEQRWGLVTSLHLPGGGSLGLYQPRHPTAHKPSTG
jgi:catechol 2,3-dioxygenase-like lactoylglutathione lyase family enzyme